MISATRSRSEVEAFGGFGDSETLGIEILSRPG